MTTPAYITVAELPDFIGVQETAQLAETFNLDRLVSSTNDFVHSYVRNLIGTALLVEVPGALKQAAADVFRRRASKDVENKEVAEAFESAKEFLCDVRDAKVNLGLVLEDNPATVIDDTSVSPGISSRVSGLALPLEHWFAL